MNVSGKYSIIIISVLIFTFLVSCNQENKPFVNDQKINQPNRVPLHQDKVLGSTIQDLTTDKDFIYSSNLVANIGEISNQKIGNIDTRENSSVLSEYENSLYGNTTVADHKISTSSRYMSVTFDNDIFNNTDYYYTNGVDIRIVGKLFATNPLSKLLYGNRSNNLEEFGLSIKQNIYTPTNPDIDEIIEGDRPFSAYLTLGTFRNTFDFTRLLVTSSELNIGVLGPASFGGNVQSSIHDIEPVGWNNQINNSLVIDYSIDLEKGIVSSPHFETYATAGFNAGTLYNKIRGGIYMRTGSFTPVYRGTSNTNMVQYWFFVRATSNLVFYDATLQGGLIGKSNVYTISGNDINRVVLSASAGFALYYKGMGLELENFYLSPEFKNAYDFRWGRIKLVFNI